MPLAPTPRDFSYFTHIGILPVFDTLYQNFTFASRALVHMISEFGACHSGECWRHISYDDVQKTLIACEFLWHRCARSNLLTFSRATAKSFTPISARAIDFHFNEPPGRLSLPNGESSQFHLALSNPLSRTETKMDKP
jgi:hypothetical protein